VLNRVPKSSASSYYGYGYFDNKPADAPAEHALAAQEAPAGAAGDRPARRAAPKQS
jgi:hypothetical protein